MISKKNVLAAKRLAMLYRLMPLSAIRSVWSNGSTLSAREIANVLTGYGECYSCSLCQSVHDTAFLVNCLRCIYSSHGGCILGTHKKTYDAIKQATTPEEMKAAFIKRARHIEHVLQNLKRAGRI